MLSKENRESGETVNAVIFDMDGVIINSEPVYVRLNKSLYKELDIEITPEEYRTFIGIASLKKWTYIKNKTHLHQSVEELMEISKNRKFEAHSNGSIPLMDGVIRLLESLQANNIRLALASSNTRNVIDIVSQKHGLSRFFEFAISGEDVSNGKPAPDIFLKAAAELGIPAENCLVIEDSNNGVRAAKAAGMRCIGFDGPAPHPQDFSLADGVIKDYSMESVEFLMSFL